MEKPLFQLNRLKNIIHYDAENYCGRKSNHVFNHKKGISNMKKQLLPLAIIASLGAFSMNVHAEPAQALLEWQGFVGGVFNTDEIALTGQGGGEIQEGELNIQPDGTFITEKGIVVEAHESVDDGSGNFEAGDALYNGDVDWSLAFTDISVEAYDVNQLVVTMNGAEIQKDTPVTTAVGNHIVNFAVNYPTTAEVSPGDSVTVYATVLAEPAAGSL
ncbi:hypothetical protein [Photobacterium sanctipauli]|uniref:hypothetical protein n=1 Tax=Photobacterium sanctipauli TaxID=1342794 RepID=UPI0011B1CC3F|nr:hypothetical protein [Photobacterium sanctipauli]